MRNRTSRSCRQSQQGISLLVVMVMLLALGLMTLTAYYLSRNQYRLVSNIQHLEQAFNQTEAVVATAEDWLNTGTNSKSTAFDSYSTALPQLHPMGHLAASALDPQTMAWSDTNSLASGDGRYVVEQLARGRELPGNSLNLGQLNTGCKKVDLFRITARSNSVRGASRTVESTYATDGC
jgi:Tfp pilus assembly protein PilX